CALPILGALVADGARGHDLATGAADVDAAAERGAGAVADVEVGHLEVQVPAAAPGSHREGGREVAVLGDERLHGLHAAGVGVDVDRSEEHTSELQSREN